MSKKTSKNKFLTPSATKPIVTQKPSTSKWETNVAETNTSAFNLLGYILAIMALIIPFIISGKLNDGTKFNRYFVFVIFEIILLGIYAIAPFKISQIPKLIKYTFLVAIVYCFWNIIVTLNAFNPLEGLYQVSQQFFYLIFIATVALIATKHENTINILTITFTIVLFLHSSVGILQFYEIAFHHLPGGNLNFPYSFNSNRNFYGSFLVLAFPLALYFFIRSKSFLSNVFGGLTIMLGLVAVLLSQTRSAWLSVVLGIILVGGIILIYIKGYRIKWLKKISIVIVASIIVATIILFTDQSDFSKNFSARFSQAAASIETVTEGGGSLATAEGTESSAALRLKMWRKTFPIIKDYPFMGIGRANWKLIMPKYGLSEFQVYGNASNIPDFPHNVYLSVAAETGIPGLLLLLAFIGLLVFLGIKSIRKSENEDTRLINIVLLSGLMCFGIDCVFSFGDSRIEHMLFFGLIVGLIIAEYWKLHKPVENIQESKISYAVLGISIILVLFNVVLGRELLIYNEHFFNTSNAEKNKSWEGVLFESKLAKSSWLSMGEGVIPIENLEVIAYKNLKQYPEAMAASKIAERKHPNLAQIYNNMGTVLIDLNKTDTALAVLKKALKIAPRYQIATINVASLFVQTGQYDSSLAYLRKIKLEDRPQLSDFLKFLAFKFYSDKKYAQCQEVIKIHEPFEAQKPWFDSLQVSLNTKLNGFKK